MAVEVVYRSSRDPERLFQFIGQCECNDATPDCAVYV